MSLPFYNTNIKKVIQGVKVKQLIYGLIKKYWLFSVVSTIVLVILKFTQFKFLTWTTVTVCLWGWILVIPLCFLIVYLKKPVEEKYIDCLNENGIRKVKYEEKDDKKIITHIDDNKRITVVIDKEISSYVVQILDSISTDMVDKINKEVGDSIGYYIHNNTIIQKHVFYSDKGTDIYRTVKKDVKLAGKNFKRIGGNNER